MTMLLEVTEVGAARAKVFTISRSLAGVRSKFAPLIVTNVLGATAVGENEEMLGFPDEEVTVNEAELVTVPAGAVTEIVPVVAPDGTVTTSCVAEALLIVAVVPLNFTVSLAGVALKFEPEMVTCVPTSPDLGLKDRIVGWVEGVRTMERMLPTAS